jgi:hypothetical protein
MKKNVAQINQWLNKYGGSPWRFNNVMLENFDVWKNLDYKDIIKLISVSRDCIICHYSLVPFFAKYVAIDIRSTYKEVANIDDWNLDYLEKILSMFPEKLNFMHKEATLSSLGYTHLKGALKRMRYRLLENGGIGIDKLIIKGGNADLIMTNNEEE